MRVTIVGIGGIGSHLSDWVARYLTYRHPGATLTLVDGDTFEDRNRERQAFDRAGNKAQSKVATLAARFPEIAVDSVPEFLSPENADFVVLEGEIVLVCVDNHATRRLISEIAGRRGDLSVISGGNGDTWGTVQIYLRRGGQDLTPPLTQDHPEIAQPRDRAPYELDCEERAAAGEPQLLGANLMAAVVMYNALWRLDTDPDGFVTDVRGESSFATETAYTEVFFDIHRNAVRGRRHVVAAPSTETEPATKEDAA